MACEVRLAELEYEISNLKKTIKHLESTVESYNDHRAREAAVDRKRIAKLERRCLDNPTGVTKQRIGWVVSTLLETNNVPLTLQEIRKDLQLSEDQMKKLTPHLLNCGNISSKRLIKSHGRPCIVFLNDRPIKPRWENRCVL